MATNKDILKKLDCVENKLMNGELEEIHETVKEIKEVLLDPEDGIIVRVNKNTYWRKQINIQEIEELKSFKQNVTHALWGIYSLVLGVIAKLIFWEQGDIKMAKLKNILQEVFEDSPQVDKYKVVEGVKNFGIVGKQLYNNNNIVETAKQLAEIAESAHHHILGEQDDWFDKISVNKNMKTLKGSVVEFQKAAKEANALNQRLTGLYEDIGHVLNRYYDIDEALEELDKPDEDELDNSFDDREDKDIDNDGDTDDSDEYLHKKRQAISKAMKETKQDIDDKPTIKLADIASNIVSPQVIGGLNKKI